MSSILPYCKQIRRQLVLSTLSIIFMNHFVISSLFGAVRIEIKNNGAFSDRQIRRTFPNLPTQPNMQILSVWKNRAVQAISQHYRDAGYLDIHVNSEISPHTADTSSFEVRFQLYEGPQYRFDTTQLSIADSVSLSISPLELHTRPDEPFSRNSISADREHIISVFENNGYPRVTLEDSVYIDSSQSRVQVHFFVNPGRLALFDSLIIRLRRDSKENTGAPLTLKSYIRYLTDLESGDTISLKKLNTITDNLLLTGLYSYVHMRDTVFPDDSQNISLILDIEENIPGELNIGIFYETQYGPGLNGRVRHSNTGRTMNELLGLLVLSLRKQELTIEYGRPFIRRAPVRFENTLYGGFYQLGPVFDTIDAIPLSGDIEVGNSAELSRQFNKHLQLSTALDFKGRRLQSDSLSYARAVNINGTIAGQVSFLDNPLDAEKGWRTSLRIGAATSILLEKNNYSNNPHVWLESRTQGYFPIHTFLLLAGRLQGGSFVGKGGLNTDRFFLGGPRSIRCFDFHELHPVIDSASSSIQSNLIPAYYLGSVELRFLPFIRLRGSSSPVFKQLPPLQLVPFIDYGKIWDVRYDFMSQKRGEGFAAGFGFRYPLFNIFNMRLDFAWGQDGTGERAFSWVIDLAQAF